MPARVALFGGSPYRVIVMAQAANVLFLPVVLMLLLIIANRAEIMGRFRNSRLTSSLGVLVVLVIAARSAVQLARLSGIVEEGVASLCEFFSPVSTSTSSRTANQPTRRRRSATSSPGVCALHAKLMVEPDRAALHGSEGNADPARGSPFNCRAGTGDWRLRQAHSQRYFVRVDQLSGLRFGPEEGITGASWTPFRLASAGWRLDHADLTPPRSGG